MEIDPQNYEAIRRQQNALEEVLRLAILVEQLNQALEGVILSGQGGGALPVEADRYYLRIDPDYRTQPNEILMVRLENLEKRISQGFQRIMQISRAADDPAQLSGLHTQSGDIAKFVQGFAAEVTLIVGLRVLLYKRRVPTRRLKLDVSQHSIKHRLEKVKAHERRYREKTREQMILLQEEMATVIETMQDDDMARDLLIASYNDLDKARKHVEDGGDLSEIPMMVEAVNLGSEPIEDKEFSKTHPSPQTLGEPPGAQQQAEFEEVTGEPAPASRPSFWRSLSIWLNTPFKVSFSDIRSGRYQAPKAEKKR